MKKICLGIIIILSCNNKILGHVESSKQSDENLDFGQFVDIEKPPPSKSVSHSSKSVMHLDQTEEEEYKGDDNIKNQTIKKPKWSLVKNKQNQKYFTGGKKRKSKRRRRRRTKKRKSKKRRRRKTKRKRK